MEACASILLLFYQLIGLTFQQARIRLCFSKERKPSRPWWLLGGKSTEGRCIRDHLSE